MMDLNETMKFNVDIDRAKEVKVILSSVHEALVEKGYKPINQIVGYLISDDPTYITSHKNARSLIVKLERDEIIEELVKSYLEK